MRKYFTDKELLLILDLKKFESLPLVFGDELNFKNSIVV